MWTADRKSNKKALFSVQRVGQGGPLMGAGIPFDFLFVFLFLSQGDSDGGGGSDGSGRG
jgi:hypothetical protein